MKAVSDLDLEEAHPEKPRTTLRLLQSENSIDLQAAQTAVSNLLVSLGFDLTDEGLADTPRRVASALAEMVTPIPFKITTFPNEEGFGDFVRHLGGVVGARPFEYTLSGDNRRQRQGALAGLRQHCVDWSSDGGG